MTCTTNSLAPQASQTFTYTAKLPTSFTAVGTGCAAPLFAVKNTATLASGTNVTTGTTGSAGTTVCVNASASFSVVKTPRTTTAAAGANVIYDVVVTNNGSAPGATSFTDNYDDSASTVTLPSNCTDATVGTDKKFTCTTGTIPAGGSVTITYTMRMPASFTGTPATGCGPGAYPVLNQVSGGAGSANAKVCVNASPSFTTTKTPRTTTAAAGGNVTYDVVVTNGGSAPGATSFTDNYDDSASVVTLPSNCTDSTVGTDKKFTCTTGTIPAGGSQTITYTM
jgi:hypothetical protein